jgi:hypothetical protein
MSETTETHYCFYHSTTETSLRCNKCGKYICPKDAVRTPVGYRCKDCVREQQGIYFNAVPVDYVITAVVTLPLAYIAALIVPSLSWLALFAGPIVGTVIAEVIRIATRKRRGQYTWIVAVACLAIATLLPMLPRITFLLQGRAFLIADVGGGFLISLLFIGIYLALAIGTLMARLRYGK